MKSFLEFVCRRLLGPPLSGSCWRCPFCDSRGASFSIRPPLANHPIKYKCFRCDAWGDEHDLLIALEGITDYGRRLSRLAELRAEYEAEHVNAELPVTFDHSGERGVGRNVGLHRRDPASTLGAAMLWRLLDNGSIDHNDLLEVQAWFNVERELQVEAERSRQWQQERKRRESVMTEAEAEHIQAHDARDGCPECERIMDRVSAQNGRRA